MRQVVKQPTGKVLSAAEPNSLTVRGRRALWRIFVAPRAAWRAWRIRKVARPNVDQVKPWRRRRSGWVEPVALLGGLLSVGWFAVGLIAMISGWRAPVSYCDRAGTCGIVSGFLAPFLALGLGTAVFLLWPVWRARRKILRKARSRPRDLVPTAGSIIGDVVGRDELCGVIMQALHDHGTRHPYLLVGGVGTGKTAVLVQLTKLLAERRALPIPVRLRDVDSDLDFSDLACQKFCAEIDAGTLASGQADKIWRQLRRDDVIVVIADGLEEAFPKGNDKERERDNLIRNAISRADEQGLPLVIASRPHYPLEATTAAIIDLEPLSEEAALEYVERAGHIQDEHRLDWIVETASVADAPLYLQMTRQLQRKGLIEHLTVGRDRAYLDTRAGDCSALRRRLFDTWMRALADGYLHPELPLPPADRALAIDVMSALACIGLLRDTIEVRFEDLIGEIDGVSNGAQRSATAAGTPPYPEIWEKIALELGLPDDGNAYYRLSRVSLAATRGQQLGIVDAYGDRVRFPHSLLQAYLGCLFLDPFLARGPVRPTLEKALDEPGPGRELLIALVLWSRGTGMPVSDLVTKLREVADKHEDSKAFDIYAAALEIDSTREAPAHDQVAEGLKKRWTQIHMADHRTLEEAKLGVVQRFGAATREVARARNTSGEAAKARLRIAERGYGHFFDIGYLEESYPVRLAIAQEIGAGGYTAFAALRGNGTGDFGQPLKLYRREMKAAAGQATAQDAGRPRTRPQVWRKFVALAWLAPMLAGSAEGSDQRDKVQDYLQAWLDTLKPEHSSHNRADLPLSLEIALAQGFKGAANRRRRNPYICDEARSYLVEQAEEMLKYARYWYSQMTLIHALCLWALPDDNSPAEVSAAARHPGEHAERNARRDRHGGAAGRVEHWLAIAGSKCAESDLNTADRSGGAQRIHPFVAEAANLAVLALESMHPERYIWIDESGIVSKVGSRPANLTDYRRHSLWIPPSAGWSALNWRAQQLVADVLVMLNLTEQEQVGAADAPDARERRLGRANRGTLPPCLTRDRRPLEPTRTIGSADVAEPGSTCLEGCAFELCPYPPSGAQPRSELSETFCRRQQNLLNRGPFRSSRRTARWQGLTRRELETFWAEMGARNRTPPPEE